VDDPARQAIGDPEPGADLGEGAAVDTQLDGQALTLAGSNRTPGEPFGWLLVAMVVISRGCSGSMIGRGRRASAAARSRAPASVSAAARVRSPSPSPSR
jgi:hypothetical protein